MTGKATDLKELLTDPEAVKRAKSKQQADYMREYRKKNPQAVEANRAMIRAQSRALRRLSAEYPDRFREIYNEERGKEGLAPVRR